MKSIYILFSSVGAASLLAYANAGEVENTDQCAAESSIESEDKSQEEHLCRDKDNLDIIGASKIRQGDFEILDETDTDLSNRLERKRAVVGNRFDNGTRNWAEEGDEFSEQIQNENSFSVSEAYKSEIRAIGAGESHELVSRYTIRNLDGVLEIPDENSSPNHTSVTTGSQGTLTVKRASIVDPSSTEGIRNIASSVSSDHATQVDVFRGKGVAVGLGIGDGVHPISLEDAINEAAKHAAQIAVFKELPAIRETSVQEAEGRFKPEVFVEARYEDRDIPTTSLAQTAGDDRLREDDFATEFGIRKRVRTGGEVTLSQRFSRLDTNLIEFNPSEQSRSRTVLSVRQPILRGGGLSFNRALDNVAKLETDVAVQEFRRQAENHLLEVTRAYWNLYLARAFTIHETRSVERIDSIVKRVEGRRGVDAQQLQVTRALAAGAEQKSSLVRARNSVRNAEARLRALINSPSSKQAQSKEIIPQDVPTVVWHDLRVENIVSEAMKMRPEIKQAQYQHKAAIIRQGIAANEALPQFDLIAEGSLNGREDNFNFGGALNDANEGDYLVGLRFSMPIGRDERKARHKRRRLEELQQRRQIETTVTSLQLETEISVNEYAVAYEEFQQRKEALALAQKDFSILQERWRRGVSNEGIVFLDMLIEANRRLMTAQNQFSEAVVTFKYAEANLERARGQYLQARGYRIARRIDDNGTPGYTLERTR